MSDSNEDVSGEGEAPKSAATPPPAPPPESQIGADLEKLAIDESSYDSLEREFQVGKDDASESRRYHVATMWLP